MNSSKDIHTFSTLMPLLFKTQFKFWPPVPTDGDLNQYDKG
jgi:hypothetical protein